MSAAPSPAGAPGGAVTSSSPARRRRILLVTPDRLGARMAGPAIRAVNMASLLGREHDVRIATWHDSAYPSDLFDVVSTPIDGDQHAMREQVDWADVLVLQGLALNLFGSIHATDKIVVCDLYDPFHLEQLEQAKEQPVPAWRHSVHSATEALNQQLHRGDFFLCANNRQRDFWLGQLAAMGRLNPDNYLADETLSRLIALVPFGTAEHPPTQSRHAIKGTVPGIGPDDKVLIWAGGVYNWFDPQTLVRATGKVAASHPDVRLFFLGMKHPNPDVPAMRAAAEAVALADTLGLRDRVVFFNQTWVDYDERQDYLLDADAGVTTHFEHIETRFSFRTRVLDYLWAGLPIITTRGDDFAELADRDGLGISVAERDADALAAAIERVLYENGVAAEMGARVAAIRSEFTWERVLAPLVEFCRDPRPAPDRLAQIWEDAPLGTPVAMSAAVTRLTLRRVIGAALRRARRLAGRVKQSLAARPSPAFEPPADIHAGTGGPADIHAGTGGPARSEDPDSRPD